MSVSFKALFTHSLHEHISLYMSAYNKQRFIYFFLLIVSLLPNVTALYSGKYVTTDFLTIS